MPRDLAFILYLLLIYHYQIVKLFTPCWQEMQSSDDDDDDPLKKRLKKKAKKRKKKKLKKLKAAKAGKKAFAKMKVSVTWSHRHLY